MSRACGHVQTGWGTCGATEGVRLYLPGPRCPDHTPARLAGRPEANPDPALSLTGLRDAWYAARGLAAPQAFTPSGETVVDQRAIASGKRRSSPGRYRQAQQAVES